MTIRHLPFTIRTSLLVLIGQRRRAYWIAVRHWLRRARQNEHPIRCSWCRRGTRYGNPKLPTSHPICHACRIEHFRDVPLTPVPASLKPQPRRRHALVIKIGGNCPCQSERLFTDRPIPE